MPDEKKDICTPCHLSQRDSLGHACVDRKTCRCTAPGHLAPHGADYEQGFVDGRQQAMDDIEVIKRDAFVLGYAQCQEDVEDREAGRVSARVAISVAWITFWAGSLSGVVASALTYWMVTR